MFESIKIYPKEVLNIQNLIKELVDFGYSTVDKVLEEGDFSHRGEVVDIFPITFELPIRIQFFNNVVEKIRNFDPQTGHYGEGHKIAIILPISRLRPTKVQAPLIFTEEIPINNVIDISPGDFVVHVEHGIGIYRGLKHLKIKNKFIDHFVIEYQDKELLYVPVTDLHLIQRYIGFEGRPPRLYKLGSKLWQKIKERVKKGVFNLAYELLDLQAKRQALS
ncbi:MAG: hypothetical protein NC828_06575, partial [Candidatus Omnitrophica bacterium]|nr:hypothetical protein [Candidatus Omnitrophota bacterium]